MYLRCRGVSEQHHVHRPAATDTFGKLDIIREFLEDFTAIIAEAPLTKAGADGDAGRASPVGGAGGGRPASGSVNIVVPM